MGKNFKQLINLGIQNNLSRNDFNQKEKEMKRQTKENINLNTQNNLFLKKLEKNETNLKQNLFNFQNKLDQELENEIKLNQIYKLKREELINIIYNYINKINYLDKEVKEKDNEINKLKNKNKDNEDKINKAYKKLIEEKNNEIKDLKKFNEKKKKKHEEILKIYNLLSEENNLLKNELINSK